MKTNVLNLWEELFKLLVWNNFQWQYHTWFKVCCISTYKLTWHSLENYAKLIIGFKSDKENDVKAPLKRLNEIVSWRKKYEGERYV